MLLRLPTSTLFPYTTLFRSRTSHDVAACACRRRQGLCESRESRRSAPARLRSAARARGCTCLSRAGRDLTDDEDRKSTRLNSSHANISYAVFCLKKKKKREI